MNKITDDLFTIIYIVSYLFYTILYSHLKSYFIPAYYNDIVVGAVCCRVDKSENSRRLYIMTLGCLAPYRRLGIGMKFLNLSATTGL